MSRCVSLLLCLTIITAKTNAQECSLPTTSFLLIRLGNLLASQSGEGNDPIALSLADPHYTCLAQGDNMERYRHLSVVMYYRTTTGNNQNPRIGQFELNCETGGSEGWQEENQASNVFTNNLPGAFTDYIDLGTLTRCSDCDKNAPNEQHCVACNSACSVGLRRCTGSSSDDCCAAFETNGMCIADTNCTALNFVANEQNNYTCDCGLSDSLCDPGYTFNSTTCSCDFTNICLIRDTPCENGGFCILNMAPSEFTCNCTGTGYTGDNCSTAEIITSSTSSFSVSSSISASLSNSLITVTSTSLVIITSTTSPMNTVDAFVSADSGPVLYAIILSAVIGSLLLIVFIVSIIYLMYFFLASKELAMAKAKASKPFSNGESHNNPLYLKPDEVEGAILSDSYQDQ